MRIVLDTHTWVWWAAEDRRLSKHAATMIRRAAREGEILVSMISIWELAKKVEKQHLVFDRPLRQWLEQATALPGLRLAELTADILIDSCDLPQPFHGDPADQIIAATARRHQATLVTKDRKLRDYAHVLTAW
jgi:PIN domain nuclease of toxin-antitoxin system